MTDTPNSPLAEGAPGSEFIRPTRAAAEGHPDTFYALLETFLSRQEHNRQPERKAPGRRLLKKMQPIVERFEDLNKDQPKARSQIGTLTNKEIAAILGLDPDNGAKNVHSRIERRTLTDENRHAILANIFDRRNLLSGDKRRQVAEIPEALYFALLNFCNTKETSQDAARARLVGTYRLWRYSVEHEGEYVSGKIDIWEDPDSRALKVEMVQPKEARDGIRESLEWCSGYMIRVSHMYLMLLHDQLTKDVRLTIFPRFKLGYVGTDIHPNSVIHGNSEHVLHMDGFGLGIDGSSGFFSPVHLAFVDDATELSQLETLLDVVPEGDKRIPQRVADKLRRSGRLLRL